MRDICQRADVEFIWTKRQATLCPVGTASVIKLPSQSGPLSCFVTASHVVRDEGPYWIRVRGEQDSCLEWERIDEWVHHASADVAAYRSRCVGDSTSAGDTTPAPPRVPVTSLSDSPALPRVGSDAYFVCLLGGEIPAFADRAVKMRRRAVVGALHVMDVPVRYRSDGGGDVARIEPCVHLIDTYSRAGFSGSPVFSYDPAPSSHPVESGCAEGTLLGILIGHFGTPGDNDGIAIVVPAATVAELLRDVLSKEM